MLSKSKKSLIVDLVCEVTYYTRRYAMNGSSTPAGRATYQANKAALTKLHVY
jgi:hypothetical protein